MFQRACDDTHKALVSGNVLSIARPAVIDRARAILSGAQAELIAELILDVMGPISPGVQGALKELQSAQVNTALHKDLIRLLLRPVVRAALASHSDELPRQLESIRVMLLNWISDGDLGVPGTDSAESNTTRRMANLLAQSSPKHPQRLRLAVVAPLAPAIASLEMMLRVDPALLSVLAESPSLNTRN